VGGFGEGWLLERLLLLVPVVMSLSVHEWAHAWCAYQLGDSTAARAGRLTLNPLEHMDPVGTFFLPLLGIPFGWAKPVPVNPGAFRPGVSWQAGLALTAAAGPLANLLIALAAGLGLYLSGGALARLCQTLVVLNVLLACFNLLPIPPLDGSRIVEGLVPERLRPAWEAFAAAGPFALAAVIALPLLLGWSLFAWPLAWAQQWLEAVRGLGAG
jgi:Zn-dependent protease